MDDTNLYDIEKTIDQRLDESRLIKSPRGLELSCKSWETEAALRCLMNNLDPEVAEHPESLIVYGGAGRAARNWPCFDAICNSLKELQNDETLIVQSGKPIGILKTQENAPRVLIANSNLVGKWSNWEHFNELDKKGLMMYGQMTAGSWIYIGSQGIIQGTYETFVEMGRQHFNGQLLGKWLLTAGLGGMGGAQPLAATMAGLSCLVIECDSSRIAKRLDNGYLDLEAKNLAEACDLIRQSCKNHKPLSVGLCANAADIYQELLNSKFYPDLVTDQTSAHDPLNGYLPQNMSMAEAQDMRKRDPKFFVNSALTSMTNQVKSMLGFYHKGIPVVDYGNNIRQRAFDEGCKNAFDFPGFVPAYIRPLFCRGIGPFRWMALSGDPEDIYKTDARVKQLFPDNLHLHNWLDMAQKKISFQGLPARICWLGLGDRAKLGLEINKMVREGELKAPIVIGRDHLDSGSVASPNRETESMKDGSDAVADWPLLNALLSCASGATWTSIHHGGGVGMGYSQHAGFVLCCDGRLEQDKVIRRVLTNDPAIGVLRHADAGYEDAIECAKENNLHRPLIDRLTDL